MGGVPCIVGTRILSPQVVSMIAGGVTSDEIITDFRRSALMMSVRRCNSQPRHGQMRLS